MVGVTPPFGVCAPLSGFLEQRVLTGYRVPMGSVVWRGYVMRVTFSVGWYVLVFEWESGRGEFEELGGWIGMGCRELYSDSWGKGMRGCREL